MATNLKKAFKTTRVRMDSLPPDVQVELEQLCMTYEAANEDAVQAERVAIIAAAKAELKRAQAKQAEVEAVAAAASHSKTIATSRMWTFFRDKDGKIVFEGLTNRLIRNNIRAQQELLGKALEEGSEGDGSESMYEEGDEGENEGNADPTQAN